MNEKDKVCYMPETPGGTVLCDLSSKTEQGAWAKLLKHAPYPTKEDLVARGYKVEKWEVKS